MLLKGFSAKFWIQILLNVFLQKSWTVAPRKTNHSFCIVTTYDSLCIRHSNYFKQISVDAFDLVRVSVIRVGLLVLSTQNNS